MKKICALMIVALACTFAACSDDDGNKSSSGDDGNKRNIEDCRPAIYTQAKGLNDALVAAKGTETDAAKICLAQTTAMTAYVAEHGEDLKNAGLDYKNYATKGAWNSVSDVACNILSSMMLIDTYNQLKTIHESMTVCDGAFTDAESDAAKSWSEAKKGLTSVEGWEAALKAAVESGSKQQ